MLWDLSEVLQYQLPGLSHQEGIYTQQVSKFTCFVWHLVVTWAARWQGQGQHEAAPKGLVRDVASLQGTAASISSAISPAFDDKNPLFQQQGAKYWTIPSIFEFHFVANGRIWLLNHKNLNKCAYLNYTDYFLQCKWCLATSALFLGPGNLSYPVLPQLLNKTAQGLFCLTCPPLNSLEAG